MMYLIDVRKKKKEEEIFKVFISFLMVGSLSKNKLKKEKKIESLILLIIN